MQIVSCWPLVSRCANYTILQRHYLNFRGLRASDISFVTTTLVPTASSLISNSMRYHQETWSPWLNSGKLHPRTTGASKLDSWPRKSLTNTSHRSGAQHEVALLALFGHRGICLFRLRRLALGIRSPAT